MGLCCIHIEDKVAVSIHQNALRSQDRKHLRKELNDYYSLTLDLGTEIKVPDFHIHDLSTAIPDWMWDREPELRQEEFLFPESTCV